MRAEAIDQLLGSLLERPVKVRWQGSATDSLMGRFESLEVELAGVATAWLPLDRVVLEAAELRLSPGLPARVRATGPQVHIEIGQDDVDAWLDRFELPFRLELDEAGLVVHTELAGFPVAKFETSLEVKRGWFVLRPRSASLFGVPGWVPSLLRSYLPLPPLSAEARLVGIHHRRGSLRLSIGIDDLEEDVTPGLVGRLQKRLLPFVA